MSYANLIMYGSVLPSYDSDKDEKEEKDENKIIDAYDREVIDADDPNNIDKINQFGSDS